MTSFSSKTVAALVVLVTGAATAQVPSKLSYQGRLVKLDGTPENGVVKLRFNLYASASSSDVLWSEEQNVYLNDGFFAVFLGELTNAPSLDAVFDGRELWLEVSVAGAAMSPRQRIVSAPYALVCTSAAPVTSRVAPSRRRASMRRASQSTARRSSPAWARRPPWQALEGKIRA